MCDTTRFSVCFFNKDQTFQPHFTGTICILRNNFRFCLLFLFDPKSNQGTNSANPPDFFVPPKSKAKPVRARTPNSIIVLSPNSPSRTASKIKSHTPRIKRKTIPKKPSAAVRNSESLLRGQGGNQEQYCPAILAQLLNFSTGFSNSRFALFLQGRGRQAAKQHSAR